MNSQKTCFYFLQGRCKFGEKCFYSHKGFIQSLIIRHAQSEFNRITNLYPDWTNPNEQSKNQLHFNINLIDCGLSPKGIEQAQKLRLDSSYLGNKKYLDIIFVSPLIRTLQTARLIIKNNDLKVKQIIVIPQLTQVLSKICDFGSSIEDKIHKYKQFNFKEMDRYLKENSHIKQLGEWQDILLDPHHHSNISIDKHHGQRYCQILQKNFPVPLENSERCFSRSLRALQIMKEICEKKKANKVIIISHNRIIRYICGRFSKGRVSGLQNCEIRSLVF